MIEMLDDMFELIYIADIETYELLFVNAAGRETFGIKNLDRLKCYKVLQGLDEPCPFCTNEFLTDDAVYNWKFTNPITGRHYLLKDRKVDWQGKKARLEIAFDATESENEKKGLKFAIDAEKMVMACAKELYQTDDVPSSLSKVLKCVGEFLSAARAYIFDIKDGKMYNTYEWCAEGVTPQINNLQNLDESLIDNWMPNFSAQDCVIHENVEDLKCSDPRTYKILVDQGITSLITAPLMRNGKLVGYFGVDNPPAEKIHNIAPLFHTLGFFIMASIRRAEDEAQLAALSYHDALTGFYNRNKFTLDTEELAGFKGSIGLVYLDINGLKNINDLYGHERGDTTLSTCARKVSEDFEGADFYRIGGDEFVVICKNMPSALFFEKIICMKNSLANDEGIQAAVGSQWTENGADIKALISKADALMYKDKQLYYKENPMSSRFREW